MPRMRCGECGMVGHCRGSPKCPVAQQAAKASSLNLEARDCIIEKQASELTKLRKKIYNIMKQQQQMQQQQILEQALSGQPPQTTKKPRARAKIQEAQTLQTPIVHTQNGSIKMVHPNYFQVQQTQPNVQYHNMHYQPAQQTTAVSFKQQKPQQRQQQQPFTIQHQPQIQNQFQHAYVQQVEDGDEEEDEEVDEDAQQKQLEEEESAKSCKNLSYCKITVYFFKI